MANDSDHSQGVIKGVTQNGPVVILALAGEIDMKSSVQVKSKLKEIYKSKPQTIVVDMTEVKFMDSSGLATLVGALKWTRSNGSQLRLAALAKGVRSVFEICRLESIFNIYDNITEALA
jgi:anti-sigma B factor antagonist